jgi:predicted aminopeptidase
MNTNSKQNESLELRHAIAKWSTLGIISSFLICCALLFGCPQYKVYEQRKSGEAKLREAESSRQIVIQEARAKLESAKMLADADTIRAIGVARANVIIGASLKNNEAYLHWLWIDNIEKNPQATIYIPTEANLPIFEATRLMQKRNEEEEKK